MGKDEGKSMFHKEEEAIYYVTHLNIGVISIISGEKLQIIKDLELGLRPNSIVVGEDNNIYIASDRNNEIIIIENIEKKKKVWSIPNNGNIQVDSVQSRLYVSNTEEIVVYNLNSGNRIGNIKGFMIADSLKLDKTSKNLFVLDVLQNEICVYDTFNFQLLKKYSNVGLGVSDFIIAENGKELYIANKGVRRFGKSGSISILDIKSGLVSYIGLPKGSIITTLEQSENYIYALNNGLHRIEVIDIPKRKRINSIKTSLPELQKIKLSLDKKKLIVSNKNNDGEGGIDIIDINTSSIINTLNFQHKNSFPYDIGILYRPKINEDRRLSKLPEFNLKKELDTCDTISILAKKILATYEEKIIFNEVIIKLPNNYHKNLQIEDVDFQQCKMIKQNISRSFHDDHRDCLVLQYDFYIPYYSNLKSENEEGYVIEGRLAGKHKANLLIPINIEQQDLEFKIKSFTELTYKPTIVDDEIKFGVSVIISTKAVVEEIVAIPACKNCKWYTSEE